ncbi:cytochrome c oxidase assembly protein [Actinomadura mexicana]|uniref:Putative membrane protein n=1 Tax=Actinomadura mexicana TaxID=134959 RepID=A0A238UM89_9ACTN|nr:cytochrome c oxidase assembly protein [Actinomadura mexicana]SNR23160.1 putative membrane protein [Actinomadura mexicana]
MTPAMPLLQAAGHPMHEHDGGASSLQTVLPLVAVALVAAGYLALWRRGRRRNPERGPGRTRAAAFLAGCALLALALSAPVDAFAGRDFRGHMLQHLIIGMYAPVALVLGAPITVLLRAAPAARARRMTGVLRSLPLRIVAHPVTALVLSAGTLPLVYFTPLYNAAMEHPGLHMALHVHFLLSGCLFAWVIAGPDPAPSRPGVLARLVVLGAAVAVHATVSQLIYGGFLIDVHAPIAQVRGGAELMYYGGDVAELLLAFALVATWRPTRRPAERPAPA